MHVKRTARVRVIYFTRTEAGEVVLFTMYAKSKFKAATLKELRNAVEKSLQANDRRRT